MQSADVSVLSVHVVCENDDLYHIGINGFAEDRFDHESEVRNAVNDPTPSITVIVRLCAHIECDPAVRFI